MQTKTSAGIICYRFNDKLKRYEVLMVRHRYTYEFSSFVKGYYNINNIKRIINLMNKMTIQEKIDIMSLNYDLLWYRVWCRWPTEQLASNDDWLSIFKKQKMIDVISAPQTEKMRKVFLKKKKHFEDTFCGDEGKRIRYVSNRVNKSGKLMWELPKGRVDQYENMMSSAVREFEEETLIKISRCEIIKCRPIIETFIDMNVKYKYVFYFAKYDGDINLNVNSTRPSQSLEIDEMRWIGSQDVPHYCENKRIAERMARVFKIVRSLKCENKPII